MTTVRALARLLRDAQTSSPEDVVSTLQRGATTIGARDLVLYLIDYEQQVLQPTPDVEPASVHGTYSRSGLTPGSPSSRCRQRGPASRTLMLTIPTMLTVLPPSSCRYGRMFLTSSVWRWRAGNV